MRRREFIGLLGGSVAWPLAAHAQQALRHVAVINVRLETDPLAQSQLKAFRQGFEKLGWTDGRNVKIDVRWAGGSADRMRELVSEFVALGLQGVQRPSVSERALVTVPGASECWFRTLL